MELSAYEVKTAGVGAALPRPLCQTLLGSFLAAAVFLGFTRRLGAQRRESRPRRSCSAS